VLAEVALFLFNGLSQADESVDSFAAAGREAVAPAIRSMSAVVGAERVEQERQGAGSAALRRAGLPLMGQLHEP